MRKVLSQTRSIVDGNKRGNEKKSMLQFGRLSEILVGMEVEIEIATFLLCSLSDDRT